MYKVYIEYVETVFTDPVLCLYWLWSLPSRNIIQHHIVALKANWENFSLTAEILEC